MSYRGLLIYLSFAKIISGRSAVWTILIVLLIVIIRSFFLCVFITVHTRIQIQVGVNTSVRDSRVEVGGYIHAACIYVLDPQGCNSLFSNTVKEHSMSVKIGKIIVM